ncbi:MAG: hypothetical protein ACI4WH_05665 [Oscillospiraceae bacterium]
MQVLISIMVIVVTFPIINLVCRVYHISDVTSVIIFISYVVQSVADTFTTFLTLKNIRGKKRNSIQWTITLLVGIILGGISSILIDEVSITVWIVSSVILSILIKKLFFIDTEKVSNTYVFLMVCFIFLIVTFIGWQSEIETSKSLNIIAFVIFCTMFAIVKNRSRLDSLILRRSKNLDSLPKDIYKYNRRLTLILCAIPIPFIIFSNRIGSALYDLMVAILRGIVYIFRKLSSLFKKESIPIEDTSPENPSMNTYVQSSSDIIGDIATIVSVGIILFLIYYYHEDIIGKFKEILENVKKVFKKTYQEPKKVSFTIPSNEGYTDYITDTPSIRYSKRTFKKDYKSYLKMNNSIESYQFGYSVLIYGLNVLGYDIKPFESVTEISNRLDNFLNSKELSKIYLSIRYNNTAPSQHDRTILNSTLKQIAKKI